MIVKNKKNRKYFKPLKRTVIMEDPKIFEKEFDKIAVSKIDMSDKFKKEFSKSQTVLSKSTLYDNMTPDKSEYRKQWIFKNKFGISVIRGFGTYGAKKGKFEIAVLYKGTISYKNPITNDVVGYLTSKQVLKTGKKIAGLTLVDFL